LLQPFPSFLDVSRSFAGRMRDERVFGGALVLVVESLKEEAASPFEMWGRCSGTVTARLLPRSA
jgi:hypothetical protein